MKRTIRDQIKLLVSLCGSDIQLGVTFNRDGSEAITLSIGPTFEIAVDGSPKKYIVSVDYWNTANDSHKALDVHYNIIDGKPVFEQDFDKGLKSFFRRSHVSPNSTDWNWPGEPLLRAIEWLKKEECNDAS